MAQFVKAISANSEEDSTSPTSIPAYAISTQSPMLYKDSHTNHLKIFNMFWSNTFRKPYMLCSLLYAHHTHRDRY